jgi:glycosyltransferase involved in cell wall biosynthesis
MTALYRQLGAVAQPREAVDMPQQTAVCPPPAGSAIVAPKVLLIIPAFNEGESVAKLISRLRLAVPDADVLVIDDGSTDDTARRAGGSSHVVSLPFNLGIGGAMQTGYRFAEVHGYDIAVQVDGDGQHRPGQVQRLVQQLMDGKTDFVVGSRFLGEGHYAQKPARLVGGWLLRWMLRELTGLHITDCTSGFRAANRRVIRAFAYWYPEDYPEPEVILLLHRAGYRIREIPVTMRQRRRGRSSIDYAGGLFYVVKVAACLLLDMARRPYNNGKVSGL